MERDSSERRVRDVAPGAERTLQAAYLVAADGANGTVRDRLDIGRTGPGALLTGHGGRAWSRAAETLSRRARLPLACHAIGTGRALGESGGQWPRRYGVRESGAVLVRPDGFVAWHIPEAPDAAESILANVLHRLCLRA